MDHHLPVPDGRRRVARGERHTVRKLEGTNRPGLNRVVWDLEPEKTQKLGNPHGLPEFVAPGTYEITITQDERKAKSTVEVLPAPGSAP